MRFRRHAMGMSLCLVVAAVLAADADGPAGKRLDNARVDIHDFPPPAEAQPAFSYPLPSGVTQAEALAMRAAAAHLPAAAPVVVKTVAERTGGALFASGQAELTSAARVELDALAAGLRGKPGLKIAIAGHTDNQRLSTRSKRIFGDNRGLSEARSLAVATYLKAQPGIEAAQISIEGHGESKPVAGNETADGMASNRRVEIRAWHDEIAVAPAPTIVAPAPAPVSYTHLTLPTSDLV